MRERRLKIDDAPGKELLEAIRNDANLKAFSELYRLRRDWRKYPLIHDRLITYGIFDDLTNGLDSTIQASLLPTAVSLAEEETDRFFLCAIFLIIDLLGGFSTVKNQENIRSRIKALHRRAKKLSLFPNMSCFWNQIARIVFSSDADSTMLVRDDDWREFISLDLPTVDNNGWQNCPGGEDAIKKEVEGIGGGEFVLEYARSAVYNDSKYWIWLYRNVSEIQIWHFYVYIVTKPDGKTEIHRHSMHSEVNISPEELVVKHTYGLVG